MAGRDPKGTIRDETENQLIVIPDYELEITEAERRAREAVTA